MTRNPMMEGSLDPVAYRQKRSKRPRQLVLRIPLAPDDQELLKSAAMARGTNKEMLALAILRHVIDDKLIDAVLDDQRA